MTVAVAALVHGPYADFLPGWLASVEALATPPDEVVVVASARAGLPASVRRVAPPRTARWDWSAWCAWRNRLADATEADWLVTVDVDDRYRPCALDGSPAWSTDVVAYGMEYADGTGSTVRWLPAPTTATVAAAVDNQVPNGSPVRADVARAVRWSPRFVPFADWGFWVQAACAGASFSATGRVDFDYRWHADTATDPLPVRAELAAWKSEEGIA